MPCLVPDFWSISVQFNGRRGAISRGLVAGQIVSVETLTVPIHHGTVPIHGGVVDCSATRWTECADTDIPCAFVLRVFYNREVNGRIYGSEKVHLGP